MKPSVIKVFSIYPKKGNLSLKLKRDVDSDIKLSHLDIKDKLKEEPLYNISTDGYSDMFQICNYDGGFNNVYSNNMKKDCNVLEDFYRFQERRNALLDNKKAVNYGVLTQPNATIERPNYSYTQLIYMAIESSSNKSLTVNDIYTWCEQNFPYYAQAVHGWKNSLRHNLSINKCFKKITKPGVGGRGSLWVVDPRERHHLVSTMHRSNLASLSTSSSIIIQRRQTVIEESLECVQLEAAEEKRHELLTIEEKPRQQWTDTRLTDLLGSPLSPGANSLASDTDHNDWHRSVSSRQPAYPIKTHLYSQCLVTPPPLVDHTYCLPEAQVVLNNPSSLVRHSFLSATNVLDSFSTSSDYNDEDWPRTPSPISLHPVIDTPPSFAPKPQYHPPKPSGKKRGRPRKDAAVTPPTPKKAPSRIPKTAHIPQNHVAPSARINNMYHLNTFFNSL